MLNAISVILVKHFAALLIQLENANESDSDTASQSANSSAENDKGGDTPQARQRRNSASRQQSSADTTSNGDAQKDYTPDQLAAVVK